MGKLILVRHGHTPLNGHGDDERLRAWMDVPLDSEGLLEATETSRRLAGYSVSAIYSSDLKRARQTAEKIHDSTDAAVFTTDELRPWNLGIFAGQFLREIIPFLTLLNENPNLPAPNGESFQQFYHRFSHCLTNLMKVADEATGNVVAVTHVRNLLAARNILGHGDIQRVPTQGGPSTGSLTIVETVGNSIRLYSDESTAPTETRADLPGTVIENVLWAS